MPDHLRSRAQRLLAREARYRFPYHIRLFLTGIAIGLVVAGILLQVLD